jgi:hypothetical protein
MNEPNKHSRMFASKARSLTKGGAPVRFLTRVGSGLTRTHLIRMERPAMDQYSFSFSLFVNYGRKMFKTWTPGANFIKLICPYFKNFHTNLEHRSVDWESFSVTNTLAYRGNVS